MFFGARVLTGAIRIRGASRGDRGYRRSGDRGLSPPRGQQGLADERFAKETTTWRDLYTKNDVASIVLQERLRRAEGMVGSLDLTSKTVADIGCGAGLMSVAAARRGARVLAIDTVVSMLDLTKEQAERDGVADRVFVAKASVESLPLKEGSVDVVVALGLLPWVPSPYTALQEIERIVRPWGYVIVTSGNPFRLQSLVDPLQHPLLSPIKRVSKFVAGRAGVSLPVSKGVPRHWHSPRQLDLMLSSAGLEKVKSLTFGFGPLTFCRKRLPERFGVPLHRRLQSVADSGMPGLRSSGAIYMVLARKVASGGASVMHHRGPVDGSRSAEGLALRPGAPAQIT